VLESHQSGGRAIVKRRRTVYLPVIRDFACLAGLPAWALENTPNPDGDLRKWLCGPQTHWCVIMEIEMATGTVKFFNSQKGFGFIQQDGGPDVFVHVSAVERAGMRGLVEGQKLTFDIEADRKSGKSSATNLQTA
jgi:CspA family cold shock protein